MNAAAKLGISITINPIGIDLPSGSPAMVSPIDKTKEWQPAFTPDEDSLLHQLRAIIVQTLDASMRKLLIHYFCNLHLLIKFGCGSLLMILFVTLITCS